MKQAEENPITPDTFGLTQGVRRILVKQAEENPITPDTALLIVPVPHDANEASRREPDHAGHRKIFFSYANGEGSKQAEENPITPDTSQPISFQFWLLRKQAEENPITPDTQSRLSLCRSAGQKQAEENPITPDTLYSGSICSTTPGSKQKRTRSRRTQSSAGSA